MLQLGELWTKSPGVHANGYTPGALVEAGLLELGPGELRWLELPGLEGVGELTGDGDIEVFLAQ